MLLKGHVAIVTGLSHAGQVGYALTAALRVRERTLPSALAAQSGCMRVQRNCVVLARRL